MLSIYLLSMWHKLSEFQHSYVSSENMFALFTYIIESLKGTLGFEWNLGFIFTYGGSISAFN